VHGAVDAPVKVFNPKPFHLGLEVSLGLQQLFIGVIFLQLLADLMMAQSYVLPLQEADRYV
jgi:hypothetical protein